MKALILGTAGIQVNIPIDAFPLDYQSIVFMDDKVSMDIAGVGYSHSLVLGGLGDSTVFLTGVGNDRFGELIEKAIRCTGADCYIEHKQTESLVSVILYDTLGRRSILREGRSDYLYEMNPDTYAKLTYDYDVAMFSMSGFSRRLLPIVHNKGIPIACDVQDISNLYNDYGKDFVEYSDIIFFSNDNYDGDIYRLVHELYDTYNTSIIGVGLGSEGALLCKDGNIVHYSAVAKEVVNTVGAGDALFASFIHCYFNGDSTDIAMQKAQIYTAEKVRHTTASKGFMDKANLEGLYQRTDNDS